MGSFSRKHSYSSQHKCNSKVPPLICGLYHLAIQGFCWRSNESSGWRQAYCGWCQSDCLLRNVSIWCDRTLGLTRWSRTETGCLSTLIPKSTNINSWQYFKLGSHYKPHIRDKYTIEEGELGELVVLVCSRPWISLLH